MQGDVKSHHNIIDFHFCNGVNKRMNKRFIDSSVEIASHVPSILGTFSREHVFARRSESQKIFRQVSITGGREYLILRKRKKTPLLSGNDPRVTNSQMSVNGHRVIITWSLSNSYLKLLLNDYFLTSIPQNSNPPQNNGLSYFQTRAPASRTGEMKPNCQPPAPRAEETKNCLEKLLSDAPLACPKHSFEAKNRPKFHHPDKSKFQDKVVASSTPATINLNLPSQSPPRSC